MYAIRSYYVELGVKVVDLSADYRLELETYEKNYCPHEDKENLNDAVYGLPEYYKDKIKDAKLIANPGCYPTASLLALLPFVDFIQEGTPIFIDAKSGVSGAGKRNNFVQHTLYEVIRSIKIGVPSCIKSTKGNNANNEAVG